MGSFFNLSFKQTTWNRLANNMINKQMRVAIRPIFIKSIFLELLKSFNEALTFKMVKNKDQPIMAQYSLYYTKRLLIFVS